MTNVLIVLTLPEPVRMQYFNHIKKAFGEARHGRSPRQGRSTGAAEILITFGAQMANHVFEKART
jgi:hypothetical protein